MWIVEVVPIKRGLPKETLTYFSAEPVADGSVVSVPIRSKAVDAISVACRDVRAEKSAIKSGSFSLKKILQVKKGSPVPSYIFDTARLAGQYYRTPRGTILNLLIPDYSFYGLFSHEPIPKTGDEPVPERLLFQGPLEDRISFYRTYIRESFAKKESVTFVCPTISDCELFAESLSRGVADFVVVITGEVSSKKLVTLLRKVSTEPHSFVIITTPSFATLMRPDTGTIILEHESSSAYGTPTNPSFDFRTIMEILARAAGKKLILGDSLLRVETLGRMELKEFGTVAPITFRALVPIEITVVPHGVPAELPARLRSDQIPALAEPLRALIGRAPEKGSHIFAFALRTGLATVTRCRDCGTVVLCEHCEAPLVLYAAAGGKRVFICNKCKRHAPSEMKCNTCQSWNLSAFGTGTAFVEEEIKRLYPDVPVFRIDREATPSRTEARKVAAQFAASPAGVLVGTEMAMFYLSDAVTDSIVVSFDTLFNIPSYRTNERIIELFLAIAERTRGKLYVQTKHADEPNIELIKSNNYATWYRNELAERIEYNYPPASSILKITWRGKEAEKDAAKDYIEELLSPFAPDIFEGTIVIKGKKETVVNAIIRPKAEDWSLKALFEKGLSETLREILAKLPDGATLSVNPDNLL
jgi:primosomal protein N' (replication factor Y)